MVKLVFEKEQKIVQIGNIKIGGQPGANPPVMIGSLFYSGHKACKDLKNGGIDKTIAENDVNLLLEWSDKAGIPVIFDLVGETADALISYIEFISDIAPGVPFLVDGLNDDSRIPAMERVKEMGLLDLAILNSIDHETSDGVLERIKNIGVKYTVLLAFEKLSLTPKKKLRLLEGRPGKYKGLLEKAEIAGIKDFIIDTAVLDLASLGFCAASCSLIKEKYGFPVGCAPTNAVFEWDIGKEKFGKEARWNCELSMCTYLRDMGADFILYGPAKLAPVILPAMSLHNAITSYYQKRVNKIEINTKNMEICF